MCAHIHEYLVLLQQGLGLQSHPDLKLIMCPRLAPIMATLLPQPLTVLELQTRATMLGYLRYLLIIRPLPHGWLTDLSHCA